MYTLVVGHPKTVHATVCRGSSPGNTPSKTVEDEEMSLKEIVL